MTHQIFISNETDYDLTPSDEALLRGVIAKSLEAESVAVPCEISILATDDSGIQALNLEFRGVDKPTDVLSFPCFDFVPGDFKTDDGAADASGLLPLGDIVLSLQRIEEQASELGHSTRREMIYLVIHSVLHLLGYDHVDEGDKKRRMREREKLILTTIDKE